MSVWRRLLDLLGPTCTHAVANDVRIGLGYTSVQIEDGRTGVAYTFGRERMGGCSAFVGERPLAGKTALDLMRYLGSENLLESSIGLAAANAIANVSPPAGIKGDVLTAVELFTTDKAVMVGLFRPLVAQLKKRVAAIEIFEERSEQSSSVRPPSEAVYSLRHCDVALITATSIINHTVDELLEAATNCREVILLGPSTPLVPEAFEETPVSVLSGMTVHDSPGLLRTISEGGGTRLFKPFVTKWNVRLQSARVDK